MHSCSCRPTRPPLRSGPWPAAARWCCTPARSPWPARCRLEASGAALEALKRTAVYHDLFRIWYDGACGTISGLRLGRTSQQVGEAGGAWNWLLAPVIMELARRQLP